MNEAKMETRAILVTNEPFRSFRQLKGAKIRPKGIFSF